MPEKLSCSKGGMEDYFASEIREKDCFMSLIICLIFLIFPEIFYFYLTCKNRDRQNPDFGLSHSFLGRMNLDQILAFSFS